MRIFGQKKINKQEILEEYFISRGYQSNGEFLENDIFIAGFPKSGNTWMQHLMAGMIYGCTMDRIHNSLVRELTPDVHQVLFYKRFQERMCFKTHHLPRKEYKNIIYLLRDGRDSLTSFYNMERGLNKNVSFREIVIEGKGLHCTWENHVKEYYNNPYGARIVEVRYENLIDDTVRELHRINDFFDLRVSNELIHEISFNCSFENMRKKEESILWGKAKDWKKGEYFVRRGKVGSYLDEMPEDLIKYFNLHNVELLKRLNY